MNWKTSKLFLASVCALGIFVAGARSAFAAPSPIVDLNGATLNAAAAVNKSADGTVAAQAVTTASLSATASGGTLDSATITITNAADGQTEILAATPSGVIAAGDIVYNAVTEHADHFAQQDAPQADFQTVLQSLTYADTQTDSNTTALPRSRLSSTTARRAAPRPPLTTDDQQSGTGGRFELGAGAGVNGTASLNAAGTDCSAGHHDGQV